MRYIFPLLLFFLLLFACQESKMHTRVSDLEIIELLKQEKINFIKISYKDESGNELTDTLRKLLNQGQLVRTFYRNTEGEVDQIRLVPVNEKNIFHEIRIRELQHNPFSDIDKVNLDCKNSEALYFRAFKRDQDVRKGILDDIQNVDKLNRDTIISIIDKCAWPKSADQIHALWYIIQHSGSGKIAYYYPKFKEMVKADLLEDSLMAKMEDRMLMYNGFPQIYGTQIAPPSSFHEIFDVEHVNERRKKVGLCPIEQKARSAGFEFKMEDYLK